MMMDRSTGLTSRVLAARLGSLALLAVTLVLVFSSTPSDAKGKAKQPAQASAAPAGTPGQPPPSSEKWARKAGSACLTARDDGSKCTAADICCVRNNGESDYCTNLTSDVRNCGGCGVTCKDSESCINGLCGCKATEKRCGGECTDASTDATNCGTCGHTCPQLCNKGRCATCAAVLGAGNVYCADTTQCINVREDESNCGKCGHQCPDGWSCNNGHCEP
jgi:hypothetical protein